MRQDDPKDTKIPLDIGQPFPCTSLCSFIMDSVGDGIFTVDLDWNIIYFNSAAGEILGLDRQQAVGRKCWDIFKPVGCQDACFLRESIAQGAKINNRSILVQRADGTRIPVSISTSPLRDMSGNIIGGVETFRDLSGAGLVTGLTPEPPPEGLCTRDPALSSMIELLPQVAESEATVLLLGESGTGKELFARALHKLSERRNGPFVAVNCGALPDTLIESELFGHRAGAFTDARKDKPGRFQLASGGTLLLDEIGDLPLPLQSKILRVLQERRFEPLGGVESVTADVRIIAATHRDLESMVEQGLFRRDLYYRLNVVQLRLPPLRERSHDIPLLVDSLLRRRRAASGKDLQGISAAAMHALLHHSFPGNVRELENILEYATILCPGGFIQAEHLPASLRPKSDLRSSQSPSSGPTMEEIRRRAAREAVERHEGNRNAACRELGITKDTLRKLLREEDS